MNTAFRHMLDYGLGTTKDTDGCYHLAKAIWRLSAELQLLVEQDQKDAAHERECREAVLALLEDEERAVAMAFMRTQYP
jgi:pyrroloquinoline quinone (PQQ) biosynthesis protein C